MFKIISEFYQLLNQLACSHRHQIRKVVLIPETAFTPATVHVYLECMNCMRRTPGIHFDAPASTVAKMPWRTAS